MCDETLEMRGYMVALEAATYILVSGVKLASHADSSSGMLTDVIMCTYELIEKCAKEIEKQDKQMRDQAFALIIKQARKSVFDGWTDWRYDLLKCGICLEDADKILDYYRASKGAFLCIQKNKRILHYGYIIKQSL